MNKLKINMVLLIVFLGSVFINNIFSENNMKSSINKPYFGFSLPGKTPQKFQGQRYYLFFNSGKECYFDDKGIRYTRLENGNWIKPVNTGIDYGEYQDFEMNISPDGKKIFFNSLNRPIPAGTKIESCQTWISDRKGDTWSKPRLANRGGMYVTSTLAGTIYYTNTGKYNKNFIARSRPVNGNYSEEEILPEPVFSKSEDDSHPCVSPDGSYVIFDSSRKNRINNCKLFITFKKPNGSWSEPANMGKYIKGSGAMAKVTADNKLIFYHDSHGVYWVSAKIIEELKPKE